MCSGGFEKSPYAALRFLLRHCGVRNSTPHSSRVARLASGAFYEAAPEDQFANILKDDHDPVLVRAVMVND
jgi:hypothetical protein